MIYSVQYMRAIAALMVVIHHAAWKGSQLGGDPLHWFHIGGAGVDLFFIISGYIMCHTTESKPDIRLIDFLKARFFRIIPLYWILTTLALIIFLITPEKVNSSGGTTSIINSYTLFPTNEKYLIQNGWTLSYEFYFYILFSTGLIIKSKARYFAPIFLISLFVALGILATEKEFILKFFTNPLLLEFVFGIICYYIFKYIKIGSVTGIFTILISIFMMVCVNIFSPDLHRVIKYGLPALLFFAGMSSMEKFFIKNNKNFVFKIMQGIGNSSYSLYLFHPFSLAIFSSLLVKLTLNKFDYLFVSLLIISSVCSSHLVYIFLERRLLKLRIRKVNSFPTR